MAARRKKPDDFGSKMLSASKVLRLLEEHYEIAPAEFAKLYAEDTSRTPRGSRPPSPEQVKAVNAWMKSKDFAALKAALGTQNDATANSTIRRVLEHQG